jgi:hypothetical protein
MQGIALKYSYTARSSCLRQADLTSNSTCAVRRRVDRWSLGVVSPERTIIGTAAHRAVFKRDLALRPPLPEGQKAVVGATSEAHSSLCREPPEDDRTGDGIVE